MDYSQRNFLETYVDVVARDQRLFIKRNLFEVPGQIMSSIPIRPSNAIPDLMDSMSMLYFSFSDKTIIFLAKLFFSKKLFVS